MVASPSRIDYKTLYNKCKKNSEELQKTVNMLLFGTKKFNEGIELLKDVNNREIIEDNSIFMDHLRENDKTLRDDFYNKDINISLGISDQFLPDEVNQRDPFGRSSDINYGPTISGRVSNTRDPNDPSGLLQYVPGAVGVKKKNYVTTIGNISGLPSKTGLTVPGLEKIKS